MQTIRVLKALHKDFLDEGCVLTLGKEIIKVQIGFKSKNPPEIRKGFLT